MQMDEMKAGAHTEDWSVILQSFPAKQKKELVKRICEIFELDKKDAEKAILNTPLILLDRLSFGMAGRIKNFLVKLGAVVEITNHEMIKKNCFQILWPEVPDLSFFLKDETKNAAEGFVEIYKHLRPGDPATAENAKQLVEGIFFRNDFRFSI